MKGLRHNVIEINDTENKDIERILVFLKPQASDVAVMTTRAEANKILQDLEVKKVRRFSPTAKLWIAVGAVAASVIICALLFI